MRVAFAISRNESAMANTSAKTYHEQDVIQGCRNNERASQKKLYERYFGRMMSIARRYIRDHEDAIEVVNTGFYKIFNNIESYKGAGSFEGWMTRIVVNSALDHLRAKKNYSGTIYLDEQFESRSDHTIDSEEYDDIDTDKLLWMIDQLPPICKTVFNLFAIDGYPHKEIGTKLNISIGTSKAHVSFARKRLREMLETEKMKSIKG
jgi:RNA polymerase sigma factor (sigma-70 family)